MAEIEQLQQQNHRTFVLVCVNFIMFLILFSGLAYVSWKSSMLISKLETDLEKVERAAVQFQDKIQHMDLDALMGKVMESAKENMGDSIRTALNQSDFGGSLNNLAEKVENTQDKLERISEAVQEANNKLQKIDTEQLAQLVSYNILKGVGDGFTKAAETNKPTFKVGDNDKSSATQ